MPIVYYQKLTVTVTKVKDTFYHSIEQRYNVKITAHGSRVSCIIIYVQILVMEVEPKFVFYVRIFQFMCHLSHSPIQWFLCDMTPDPVPEPVQC